MRDGVVAGRRQRRAPSSSRAQRAEEAGRAAAASARRRRRSPDRRRWRRGAPCCAAPRGPAPRSRASGCRRDPRDEAETAGVVLEPRVVERVRAHIGHSPRVPSRRSDPMNNYGRFYESFGSVGLTGCRYRALVSLIDAGWAAWLPEEFAAAHRAAGGGSANRRDLRRLLASDPDDQRRERWERFRLVCPSRIDLPIRSRTASRRTRRSDCSGTSVWLPVRRRGRSSIRSPSSVLTLDHDDLRELDQVRAARSTWRMPRPGRISLPVAGPRLRRQRGAQRSVSVRLGQEFQALPRLTRRSRVDAGEPVVGVTTSAKN